MDGWVDGVVHRTADYGDMGRLCQSVNQSVSQSISQSVNQSLKIFVYVIKR